VDPFVKLARVPSRPQRSDLLIAGVLALWAVLEAVLVEGPGSTPVRIAFALAVTVPLVFRRQWPLEMVAVIGATVLLLALIADQPEKGTTPFPSLLLAEFSVALYARRLSEAIVGLGIVVAVLPVILLSPFYESSGPVATNIAITLFFICGSWGLGLLLKRRADQARQAVAESGDLARIAVSEERDRIARELHDVIAHSVSVIAVQAGAAEQLITDDPGSAKEHLGAVRRAAREAMTEMRRLLGVLREDEPSYDPQPGISRLPDLLDEARSAGHSVQLWEQGERPKLSPGLDLTVYRIVQEALTNARKHASAAPTTVLLRYGTDVLELEVVNEIRAQPAEADGGHGLVGMKERARLFGGSFEAGREDGRFRVHVFLPLEESRA
jgi:signal transduction histidine kinase